MRKSRLYILLLSLLTVAVICINGIASPGPFHLDIYHRDPLPEGTVSVASINNMNEALIWWHLHEGYLK